MKHSIITIPATSPHVYVFMPAVAEAAVLIMTTDKHVRVELVEEDMHYFKDLQVATSGQTTMNYNVNGGNSAPFRSNDGNGNSGNNSSFTLATSIFLLMVLVADVVNVKPMEVMVILPQNGTVVFGGNGGQAPAYIREVPMHLLHSFLLTTFQCEPRTIGFANSRIL